MKFNDGFWLLKNGVKAFYGLEVVQSRIENDSFVLHVATKSVNGRGDTLGGPILTVKMDAPTEGVIGVSIDHFKYDEIGDLPSIPLFSNAPALPCPSVQRFDGGLALASGPIKAEISLKPYSITFRDKQHVLTAAGYKHQAVLDVPYKWTLNSASNSSCTILDPNSNPYPDQSPPSVKYINSELNISPGELFYGLGEQFGAFVKNGQAISVWNRDGGTSSEQAYKCVPFYISNRGYGVFINHPGEVEVEVGSEKVSRVGVSVQASSLQWFIIYGETPLQILERYTRMTGRPALPPSWTFGLWLSTSFLTDYSESTVSAFLQGMKDRACHVRVFHFDCFWMKQYEWCSFTFDPDNFPDPKAYLSEIKAKYGVKVCVWINPYISQVSPAFLEAASSGYLIRRKDGSPWQWDLWQPGLGIVDITNPDACSWYSQKLDALLDLGVDCFKTDFGERIPHHVQYNNKSDPIRMHNMYSVLYNELVFNLLKKRFGDSEAVVFARASAAGGQKFPVHWGGDCESTFEAMAETLRGGLSLTLSGFAFSSHDIGGFEGHPDPEIYLRWVAFGLFSSHSRLHGSSSYRVPWVYGEEASKTLAKFVEMKHRLMPYLYFHAIEAHRKGYPLQRAMFIEFIKDRTTHYLDRQYMLGPSLLVAPVLVPETDETEYYLPAGRWTSLFDDNNVYEGPSWIKERVPLNSIPVWVRNGSIMIFGPAGVDRPDYALHIKAQVKLYEIDDGFREQVEIPSGEGTDIAGTISVQRLGYEVRLRILGDVRLATVTLVSSLYSIKATSCGSVQGKDIVIDELTEDIIVQLKDFIRY